jgi:hypothetical protein
MCGKIYVHLTNQALKLGKFNKKMSVKYLQILINQSKIGSVVSAKINHQFLN